MFLHNQSRFPAELQGDVVPGNTTVLPANSSITGWLQERSTLHVSRWNVSELFPRSQSVRQVCYRFSIIAGFFLSAIRRNASFSNRFFHSIWNSFKCIDASSTTASSGKCVKVLIPRMLRGPLPIKHTAFAVLIIEELPSFNYSKTLRTRNIKCSILLIDHVEMVLSCCSRTPKRIRVS